MTVKECRACGKNAEHTPSGFVCRTCQSDKQQEHLRKVREKYEALPEGTLVLCTLCGVEKPKEAFRPDRLSLKKPEGRCTTCLSAQDLDWSKRHPQNVKDRMAAYRATPGGRRAIREASLRWYRKNKPASRSLE